MLRYQNISLSKKIALLFLVLIIIPTVVIGLFMFYASVNHSVAGKFDETRNVLQTMKASIESQAAIIESNVTLLAYNPDILNLLSNPKLTQGEKVLLQMNKVIKHIEYANTIAGELDAVISLFPTQDDVYESYFSIMRLSYLNDEKDYHMFQDQSNPFAWVGIGTSRPVIPGRYDINNSVTFNCYRVISSDLYRNLGVIKCAVSPDSLFSVVNEWQGEDDIFIMHSGEWIYGSAEEMSELLKQSAGDFSFRDGDHYYIGSKIDGLGAYIVSRINASMIYKNAYDINRYLLLIVAASGILLFISVHFILQILFRRLLQTVQITSRIEAGDFNVRLVEGGRDEIGRLMNATNTLLDCAQRQVQELHQKSESERKAQILALQYQINPHFLFNTLNWLQMAIEANVTAYERRGDLSEAIAVMAEVFRYNLAGDPIVLLEKEQDHLWMYTKLHQLRKPGCINLQVNIEPEHEHLQTMRFMFQPIIENAIKHGLRDRQRMTISVRSSYQDNILTLVIDNDGAHIPHQELVELNEGLSHPPEKAGVGLSNTAARLRLLFGEESSIVVHSVSGSLTSVVIKYRTHPNSQERDYHEFSNC